MTWVIGATTLFGYGVLVSDTCVSKQTRKGAIQPLGVLLQKARQVGDFIVAGFAGDVELGLTLLDDLEEFLRKEKGEEELLWHPGWVAENWADRARYLRNRTGADASLLMVGVEQDESGGLYGSRAHVVVLRSPDFLPEIVSSFNQTRHIGSGARVEYYREGLEGYFSQESWALMQAEIGGQGVFGQVISSNLQRRVFNNPTPGVNEHMHTFIVRLGQVDVMVNQPTVYRPDGTKIELKMPPVARTMDELRRLLNKLAVDPVDGNLTA